jgi:hypothetical protein
VKLLLRSCLYFRIFSQFVDMLLIQLVLIVKIGYLGRRSLPPSNYCVVSVFIFYDSYHFESELNALQVSKISCG